jgi:serine/threonine-protein kinase
MPAMPMDDEMNDRPSRRRGTGRTQTVVHRTYHAAYDEETRAASLVEPTALLETEPPAAPVDAAATLSPRRAGAVLGDRYEIGEVLGRGASGVVFRGRDQLLGREVAIKLLHTDLTGDREASARFQQEARLAARIHHPNAVSIFDTGVHDGQPFIVMECLSGETLSNRIAAQPLSIGEARTIGKQVLDALDAAHREGVIHRDVKPGNLLMATDGSVKVADFGIATATDRTALTNIGSVVGTLAYLAPERLQGAEATAQSDLYSVGVVLYEALTGSKPFAGDTPVALLSSISNGAAIDIRDRRADIPDSVAGTIMRALQREPAGRPGSAAEMATALAAKSKRNRRSSLPAPPLAPPPLPPRAAVQVAHPSGRRRLAFASVVAAALATTTVAFAAREPFHPSAPSTTSAEDQTGAARVEDSTTTTRATTTTAVPTTTRVATTRAPTTAPTTRAVVTTPKGKGKNKD